MPDFVVEVQAVAGVEPPEISAPAQAVEVLVSPAVILEGGGSVEIPDEYLTLDEGNALYKALGYVPSWAEVTGKPSTFPPSTHEHTNLPSLDEDEFAETDPITDYPEGITNMPVSAAANWDDSGAEAVVVTERAGDTGGQRIIWGSAGNAYRNWDTDADPDEWTEWEYPVSASHQHSLIQNLGTNSIAETAPLSSYPSNESYTWFGVEYDPPFTDWNDTGHNCIVQTHKFYSFVASADIAIQRLTDQVTRQEFLRSWDGLAWSTWVAFSMEGHTHTNLPPLDEDEHDESDPITAWPEGPSIMPVSATADWAGNDSEGAVVFTYRSGSVGRQQASWASGYTGVREWDGDSWSVWVYPASEDYVVSVVALEVGSSISNHVNSSDHQHIKPLDEDAYDEADDVTAWPAGASVMKTSVAANWNGQSAAGTVVTFRTGSFGIQKFSANGAEWARQFYSGEWINWTEYASTDAVDFLADRANHTGTQALGTITGHDKAAHDALDIDADTLDGINSTGFVQTGDYEDSDVLAKVKNVDGAGSGLDADTLDGVEGSGYAASTRTISTTAPLTGGGDLSANRTLAVSQASETATGVVELATDAETQTGTDTARAITPANLSARSATESRTGVAEIATQAETNTGTDDARFVTPLKARTANDARYVQSTDYEDADVLAKVKNVDGSGSGLDADTVDGVQASAFLQSVPAEYLTETEGNALYEPLDSAYTKAEADTRYVNESDHTKAAHDALDIDADTLDGINSTGFVQTGDYEDLDVLAKVKNVDGAGSGLDADTVDGIQASAFLQSLPTHASTHTNGTDDIQNATAAQKGLATAAQITKLDGIEANATADMTASEILTALLTVDTNTSGLNADTLDGVQGSGYVQTGDYEDADVLAKLLNVDGSGSGLDADLLDGNHAAAFATAANLTAHIDDLADAHDASAISFAPDGSIAATTVQAAIVEVRDEAAGGAGGTGETTIDFGTFPGTTDATVDITGQTSIASGSIVEAWVKPKDTADHTADEHWVEHVRVLAGNVVAGTGFTIYGVTTDDQSRYGLWNVAWRWA